jgi:hypothetical protein
MGEDGHDVETAGGCGRLGDLLRLTREASMPATRKPKEGPATRTTTMATRRRKPLKGRAIEALKSKQTNIDMAPFPSHLRYRRRRRGREGPELEGGGSKVRERRREASRRRKNGPSQACSVRPWPTKAYAPGPFNCKIGNFFIYSFCKIILSF